MISSELRIGNIVNTSDYINLEVLGISSINVGLKLECTKFISVNIDELKPIPLTEEWLIKFNYELKGGCYYQCTFSDVEFFISDGKLFCELFGNSLSNIEYVHDLQNLHFAIYKEELKIK